jgi:hypothetical protein
MIYLEAKLDGDKHDRLSFFDTILSVNPSEGWGPAPTRAVLCYALDPSLRWDKRDYLAPSSFQNFAVPIFLLQCLWFYWVFERCVLISKKHNPRFGKLRYI